MVYPVATGKIGTYPALTEAGGGYLYDEVLEYRVWVHPDGGDDYYHAFKTFEAAEIFSKSKSGAEAPLALVLQKTVHWVSWSENDEIGIGKEDRIAEWKVEWLEEEGNHYTPEKLRAKLVEALVDMMSKTTGISTEEIWEGLGEFIHLV